MAAGTAVVTISDNWSDGKRQFVIGTIVLANDYAAGGIVIAWTDSKIKSSRAPKIARIDGIAGFKYEYDATNKKILIRGQQPTSATSGIIKLDEIASAALPAGVTGDTISFFAIFGQNV